jgi:predicted alpha/beta-fold hydrolase
MGIILQIIFSLILVYILYRLLLKTKPKIYMNTEGKIAPLVAKMKTLKSYKPTPWLINGLLHTLWGMHYKGRKNYKPVREDIDFSDGGQVTIEHFVLETTKDTAPILFIIHTMGGGSREPCTNWAAYNFMKKGYRVIICSCRGCNGSKVKTKRICDSSNYQDTHVIIEYISKKYPKAKNKFLLGFSMGSMISVRYATFYDDIDGIIAVSHVVDNKRADILLTSGWRFNLLAKPLLKAMTRGLMKTNFYTEEEKKKILNIKTSAEFHNLVTAKNMGLNNCDEYYELTKLYGKPAKVKVPTLVITAEDDPLTSKEFIDEKELIDKSNINLAFILTKEGGHVSFCEGLNGKGSYIEDVSEEFFNLLMKKD